MFKKRTDLALEAKELWNETADKTTKLEGVEAREREKDGFTLSWVKILNSTGAEALDKPIGNYYTLSFSQDSIRDPVIFEDASLALGNEIKRLLAPADGSCVLIACLGNFGITPDSIGPKTAEHLLVTRHLVTAVPNVFGSMRPVAVIRPGVLGNTGLESFDVIKGVIDRIDPGSLIVVDALASRRLERVCSTIQVSDSGIVPGSGVGNARKAINRDNIGIPVISVGAPTVVDAATLACDMLEQSGISNVPQNALEEYGKGIIVTPREIDSQVASISKLIGMGINLALHEHMEPDEIEALLS